MAGIPQQTRVGDGKGDRFRELDVLKSADGLVGIISQRIETGVITFMIMREFPLASGEMQKTSFIPEHMSDAFIAMAGMLKDRIAKIRREGGAPPARRARRG